MLPKRRKNLTDRYPRLRIDIRSTSWGRNCTKPRPDHLDSIQDNACTANSADLPRARAVVGPSSARLHVGVEAFDWADKSPPPAGVTGETIAFVRPFAGG